MRWDTGREVGRERGRASDVSVHLVTGDARGASAASAQHHSRYVTDFFKGCQVQHSTQGVAYGSSVECATFGRTLRRRLSGFGFRVSGFGFRVHLDGCKLKGEARSFGFVLRVAVAVDVNVAVAILGWRMHGLLTQAYAPTYAPTLKA